MKVTKRNATLFIQIPPKSSNYIPFAYVVDATALFAFPYAVFVRKSLLDIEIGFTLVAEPENRLVFVPVGNAVTAVGAFPNLAV